VQSADELRRRYAEQVVLGAPRDLLDALVEAFATVPREVFLGAGPWRLGRHVAANDVSYETTPDASPVHVYRDVVISLVEGKGLNNGQPSGHARWLLGAAPRLGERVMHVGCGTGYYTAILAELVGSSGHVLGYDVEPDLLDRARANLAAWPHVEVELGDASAPRGEYDVIYVNAGATHPRPEWLAALRPRGRLVLPLTVHTNRDASHGTGVMAAIERPRDGGDRWPFRVVTPAGFYDCAHARDPDAETQLRELLDTAQKQRKMPPIVVRPGAHDRGEGCLVHVAGACLSVA
jgi:protein-L-isoaspartate(D-aspartate) O-methyltransferase